MRLFVTTLEPISNPLRCTAADSVPAYQSRCSFSNGDGLPMLCAPAPRGVPGRVQGRQEEGSGPDRLLEEVAVQQCRSGWSVAGLGQETGCG